MNNNSVMKNNKDFNWKKFDSKKFFEETDRIAKVLREMKDKDKEDERKRERV